MITLKAHIGTLKTNDEDKEMDQQLRVCDALTKDHSSVNRDYARQLITVYNSRSG